MAVLVAEKDCSKDLPDSVAYGGRTSGTMGAFLAVFRFSSAFRVRTPVDLVATSVTSGGVLLLLFDTAVVGGAVGGHAVA